MILSPIAVWTVLSVLVTVILYKVYKIQRFIRRVNMLPGPKVESLLMGNANILRDGRRMGMNPGLAIVYGVRETYKSDPMYKKSGFVRIWIGPFPMIAITSPEAAELVFASNILINKANQYDFFLDWLGDGLLNSSGLKWKSRRKMLTPSFHFNILEDFVPTMRSNTTTLIRLLEEARVASPEGIITDVSDFILKAALDIICETAMGVSVNAQTNPKNEYIEAVNTVGIHLIDRMVTPIYYSKFFWDWSKIGSESNKSIELLHKFTLDVIKRKKEEYKLSNKSNNNNDQENNNKIDSNDVDVRSRRKRTFMDTLIEEQMNNPNLLTDEDIRAEVDTFMFEGHDTTGWGASWATFLLGLHPDVQEKVYQEIQDVVGDEEITMDHLRLLKYLECVIKEAQRLFPSVPFIGRKHDSDFDLGNGHIIPAGVQVGLFIYLIHRDPAHWPEPETFDPDRFLPENSKKRHPFASVHFSAGPRNCIGQKFAILEEKSLLVNIFRKYKVKSLKTYETIMCEQAPGMILRTESTLPVKLELR